MCVCTSKKGTHNNLVLEHGKKKDSPPWQGFGICCQVTLKLGFHWNQYQCCSKIITKTLWKRYLCSWFLSLQYCHHSSKYQEGFWFWEKFIQWVPSCSKACSACKVMKGQLYHPEEEGARTESSIDSTELKFNFNMEYWLEGLCLSMTIGSTSVDAQADLTEKRIALNLWQASKEICRADSMDVNTRGYF